MFINPDGSAPDDFSDRTTAGRNQDAAISFIVVLDDRGHRCVNCGSCHRFKTRGDVISRREARDYRSLLLTVSPPGAPCRLVAWL